eukprot:GFUD01063294.1.p1 GENE.GFUD01063294.1~~GFUD01063294.1.p1  ORF type:complete len:585 (+),score=121.15 GFUD01063294.1:23-1777(+)
MDRNFMETVKMQFTHTFRTGNVVIDTLITGLVIMTSTYLMTNLRSFLESLNNQWLWERVLLFMGLRYNKITLNGRVIREGAKRTKVEFTPKFEAVLEQIQALQNDTAGVFHVQETPNKESKSPYVVAQNSAFSFQPNVFGRIKMVRNKTASAKISNVSGDKTGPDYSTEDYTIEVFSRKKSLTQLEKIVGGWTRQYKSNNRQNIIVLNGKLSKSVDGWGRINFEFSDRFFAVLHKMSGLGYKYPDIEELKELHLEQPGSSYFELSDTPKSLQNKASIMIPDICELEKNVLCKVDWHDSSISDKAVQTEYTIRVFSAEFSVEVLAKKLDDWRQEYEDHKHSGSGLRYFVYSPPKTEKDKSGGFPRGIPTHVDKYAEFAFSSSKTFQNVFFPQKDTVVTRVNFFVNNQTWYEERGIPYTLGFLFHGEPGCGKTSTIKEIANMTERHIVSVPLKNVKTALELYEVFYAVKINQKAIPINKRLYVLEDIDCAKMMVITTNHPEKLDKALIRPGRVDLKIKFGKSTSKDILDIFNCFYGENQLPSGFDNLQCLNGKWTPAELAQVLISNMNSPEAALEVLCNQAPDSTF